MTLCRSTAAVACGFVSIAAIGGPPKGVGVFPPSGRIVRLTLPWRQDGMISFDPSRVRVFSIDGHRLDNGAAFRSLGPRLLGDVDGDGNVGVDDVAACFTALNARRGDEHYSAGADVDADGWVTAEDFERLAGLVHDAEEWADVVVTSAGERAPEEQDALRGDPDVFVAPCGAQEPPLSTGGLMVTPRRGRLGTPVALTLTAPGGAYQFDAATTAVWEGRYLTADGTQQTPSFRVTYEAGHVREKSTSQATIVMGDGTFTSAPDAATIAGPGVLAGTLTVRFSSGASLSRPTCFMLDTGIARLETIWYRGGIGGRTRPQLDGTPAGLPIMRLAGLPDPAHPRADALRSAVAFHLGVVVLPDSSSDTQAVAPPRMLVDLVTSGPDGREITRYRGLELRPSNRVNDPGRMAYVSDLDKPVLCVDFVPDRSAYPQFVFVQAVEGGSISVAPSSAR